MASRLNSAGEADKQMNSGQEQAQSEPQDEVEMAESILHPYAVTHKGGLRLREHPGLDAPVIAVLPFGAGVFGDAETDGLGWRRVFTGRLHGWMMDKYLEALPLPELGDGAE